MKRLFATLFISVLFSVSAYPKSLSRGLSQEEDIIALSGYWEGEFMPENDFTLILRFELQNEIINGRVILFQGEYQIQDDPLSEIYLNGDSLFFRIPAKSTDFSGIVDIDKQQISGRFLFPDNSLRDVLVRKVNIPSKGEFEEIQVIVTGSQVLEKKYTPDQLRHDLSFLRNEMQTHPQLNLYTSAEEFDEAFNEAYNSIQDEMTEEEFFRIIAPVVALIKCSHTGIRFSDNLTKSREAMPYLIPLDIQFFENEAYVIHNFSNNTEINPGMKVLSVNGMTSSDILEKLISSVTTDGENPVAALSEINANFAFVFSLYLGNPESFAIELENEKGSVQEFELKPLEMQDYDNELISAYPEDIPSGPLPIEMEIEKDKSLAVLKVYAFWAPEPHLYIDFLEESFKKLKEENIQNLIIDVRGNQGGYPYYAAELLTYMTAVGFPYFVLPELKGEFEPLYDPIEVKENVFQGRIFVLMDGGCLSTTGHFLSLVKYHELAELVGETSGASFYCNDNSKRIKLPATGINLNMAQTTFQTAVQGFEKGDLLEPDHLAKPSLDDLIEGKDAVLEYTIELIEK